MDPLQSPNKKRGVQTNCLNLTPTRIQDGMRNAAAPDGLRNDVTPSMSRMSLQPSAIVLQDIIQNPELLRTVSISSLSCPFARTIEYNTMFKVPRTDTIKRMRKTYAGQELVWAPMTNLTLRANCYESLAYLQNNTIVMIMDPDLVGAEMGGMSNLKRKLNKLRSLIECLRSLHCKGIIDSKDSAEIKEILKTLKELNCTLNDIKDAIRCPGKLLINYMATLDKFLEEYKEVENIQANFENALGKVEAIVLEGTPLCLP